ncbi:hypothetical protein H8F21_13720 [Pseudomonas sp. P66]|uniref:Uncharacterized protein n=1 Tax=Pseudomonas arcuscaelestis TaxID=2710591 RepID=A0ABS2BYD1_9PSED|nr:hypothetical protein [Pseudomonas arcuscaelestis]MBM5458623.1 hypothetical protein [Pseudomonas arcuscaelestis]
MSNTCNPLPQTEEIKLLLRTALAGTGIAVESITTTVLCLQAIDQARRSFPETPELIEIERRRLDAALRLVCLVGYTNATAAPGLANKEAAQLFRDFANGVPVSADRMKRHHTLSRLSVVNGADQAPTAR